MKMNPAKKELNGGNTLKQKIQTPQQLEKEALKKQKEIEKWEREKERPAYKYFKKVAKPLKGEKEASLERRREHGAHKKILKITAR